MGRNVISILLCFQEEHALPKVDGPHLLDVRFTALRLMTDGHQDGRSCGIGPSLNQELQCPDSECSQKCTHCRIRHIQNIMTHSYCNLMFRLWIKLLSLNTYLNKKMKILYFFCLNKFCGFL